MSPPELTEAARDVIAKNGAFYAAFQTLDFDAMTRVWSDAAPISCVHPGWAPIVGQREVIESWRAIFAATSAISFTLRDVRAQVSGDSAWVILIEQIEERHGDRVVRAEALATNVFVRERGDWRLVHHHASPMTGEDDASGDVETLLN